MINETFFWSLSTTEMQKRVWYSHVDDDNTWCPRSRNVEKKIMISVAKLTSCLSLPLCPCLVPRKHRVKNTESNCPRLGSLLPFHPLTVFAAAPGLNFTVCSSSSFPPSLTHTGTHMHTHLFINQRYYLLSHSFSNTHWLFFSGVYVLHFGHNKWGPFITINNCFLAVIPRNLYRLLLVSSSLGLGVKVIKFHQM